MLYTKSLQFCCRKVISVLIGLKVSSLPCECASYMPQHNSKDEHQGIEFSSSSKAKLKYAKQIEIKDCME